MTGKNFIILFIAGVLYALGYPSILAETFLVSQIIGLILFLSIYLKQINLMSKICSIFAFNLGFVVIGFYWIAQTLQEFGHLPYIIALLLNGLFALISLPHLWFLPIIDKFIKTKSYFLQIWTYSSILCLLEVSLPQQFDLYLGHPWIIFHEYLGLAPFFGLPSFSFISYLVIFSFLFFIKYQYINKFIFSTVSIFIILNPLMKIKYIEENQKEIKLRLVQANISSFLKVDAEKNKYASVSEVISTYKRLSIKDNNFSPDLIIWPETAYPYGIKTNNDNFEASFLPSLFGNIALKMNSELIIGGYDLVNDQKILYSNFGNEYNTSFFVSDSGELKNKYHKHILIPFGETLPLGPLTPFIARYFDNIAFFSEGKSFPVFKTRTGHEIINSICYEVLKSDYIRSYLNSIQNKPHFMINLTNDSWYGKTSEPRQHLFLTKWRSIEYALPIVRSTNTGITTIINAYGREEKTIQSFKSQNLDYKFNQGLLPVTFYQKYGDYPLFFFIFIGFIFQLIMLKFKHVKNN